MTVFHSGKIEIKLLSIICIFVHEIPFEMDVLLCIVHTFKPITTVANNSIYFVVDRKL